MDAIADELSITEEDRDILLPSGKRTVASRLSWALYYLARADMLENKVRGVYSITPKGRALLNRGFEKITAKILREESPEFAAFHLNKKDGEAPSGGSDVAKNNEEDVGEGPGETLERAYGLLRNALKDQLLKRVDDLSPKEFEHLIIALIKGLDYCGERGSVKHTGGPGDGGVDGVIYQDSLGLERVYLQAKKNNVDNKIDAGKMNEFVGALTGKKANKGIFVTTSSFTQPAKDIIHASPHHIALIDRNRLGDLMIDHDIGIQARPSSKPYILRIWTRTSLRGWVSDMDSMRLFSYIVVSDSGFAPNPYHGYCTLACCKPKIRKAASVGDWVIGLTPKHLGYRLVYAMKVKEVPSIAEYWRDTRFAPKRPDFGNELNSLGDNIYEPMADGTYLQHQSWHSAINSNLASNDYKRFTPEENRQTKIRDLSGGRVLVASEFVYFCIDGAIELPPALRKALAVGRGHKSNFPPETVARWQEFIARQAKGIRCHEPHIAKAKRQCFRPPSKAAGNTGICK